MNEYLTYKRIAANAAPGVLAWYPEHHCGYYPVDPVDHPYGRAYFDKYAGYAKTARGRAILADRIGLVESWLSSDHDLVDFGIGCGAFVEAMNKIEGRGFALGYDVNPVAEKWLKDRNSWYDPKCRQLIDAATFWDSLEHMSRPDLIIRHVRHHVFCCLPIFRDAAHVLGSKHYRRDEHYWYFTTRGITMFFDALGFERVHHSHAEVEHGREDIETFVFVRR